MPTSESTALSVRRLRKVYGGTVALADVDVDIATGEIHGLLGENGAGKSTLVRLIAGLEPADGGSLSLFGSELPPRFSSDDVAERGVVFIHQNLGLVDDMSVLENIALAAGYARRGPFISWRETRKRALKALETMGVDLDPDALISELPMSMRAVAAIGRALMRDVKLLVLDEPTATLGVHEVERLFGILRRLRDQGVAIVLISHRLDEIVDITDRVTVLRDGRLAGVARSADVSEAELIRMIIGTDLPPRVERSHEAGAPKVAFEGVRAGIVGPLTFEACEGEVLGITGLTGAGHTTIPQILFGLEPLREGRILLSGEPYRPRAPRDAVNNKFALVPADRYGRGAVTTMDLRENLNLNPAQSWVRPIDRDLEMKETLGLLKEYDVRPQNPHAEFSTLSGGNAQKVVLARCLSAGPRVLILEEPTAAVDIGARAEIHRRIRQIAATGRTVILISSDLEEVEQVCDRALVMERGRIQGELKGSEVTVPNLLEAAYGVEHA